MSIKWQKMTAILVLAFISALLFAGQTLVFGFADVKSIGRFEESLLFPCIAFEALVLALIYLEDNYGNGWKNKLRNIRRGCFPSSVAPIDNDVEMSNIGAPAPEAESQQPASQSLNQV